MPCIAARKAGSIPGIGRPANIIAMFRMLVM
jgi:hypothetical protein